MFPTLLTEMSFIPTFPPSPDVSYFPYRDVFDSHSPSIPRRFLHSLQRSLSFPLSFHPQTFSTFPREMSFIPTLPPSPDVSRSVLGDVFHSHYPQMFLILSREMSLIPKSPPSPDVSYFPYRDVFHSYSPSIPRRFSFCLGRCLSFPNPLCP